MKVFNPQAVKDLRELLGISQAEAGRKAGFGGKCPGQTWYAYETGKVTNPRKSTLENIAKSLRVEVAELMIDDGVVAQVPTMGEIEAAYAQGFADGAKGVVS